MTAAFGSGWALVGDQLLQEHGQDIGSDPGI